MASQTLIYALWLASTLVQGALAAVIWRRKLVREFPLFFCYTIMHVLRACGLAVSYQKFGYASFAYFASYWAAEAIDTVLQLAVTYEVYVHVFKRYEAVAHLGKVLFRWSLIALLLTAIASTAAVSGSETDVLRTGVLVLHQSTIVITGGLLLLLFIFTVSFGLTWRRYVFGIAAGLCLCTAVELAVVVVLTRWGPLASSASSLIHSVAYSCSVLLWAGYFFQPEKAVQVEVPATGGELEKWNEALAELLNR